MADPNDDNTDDPSYAKRVEIDRLSAKLGETKDPDLRDGLALKIEQLAAELRGHAIGEAANGDKAPNLAALEAQVRELQVALLEAAHVVERGAPTPDAKDVARLGEIRQKLQSAMQGLTAANSLPGLEKPPTPTPAQQAQADNLVRQAKVAKMRGQTQLAGDLLVKASEAAPGAVSVLEALGDDMMERGQAKASLEAYGKALLMSPGNPGIERKYADAIVRSQGNINVEEMLRMSESPFATSDAASVRTAMILSAILPGLGQVVIGQQAKGAAMIAGWLSMLALAFYLGLGKLIRTIMGQGSDFNPVVFGPLLVAVVIHISAVAAFGMGKSERPLKKAPPDRPRPPVDLPFE